MSELANCSMCGKIYVKTVSHVCPTCQKEVDRQFDLVYSFIRKKENRESTILEVNESTGVSEKLIVQFIKEGRLRTSGLINLKYPCQSCGALINTGTLCDTCRSNYRNELSTLEKQQQKEFDVKSEEANRYRTYYTQDRKK